MNSVSVDDLAKATRGQLRLAVMPPIDGAFTCLNRSVGHSSQVRPGDLYWDFSSASRRNSLVEEAFARGARGVVSQRTVEPWAGSFALKVDDVSLAVEQGVRLASQRFGGMLLGVLGPCGKTVVGELIHQVLGPSFRGQSPDRSEEVLFDGGDPQYTRFWTDAMSLPIAAEFRVIEFPNSDPVSLAQQLAAVSPKGLVLTGWPCDGDSEKDAERIVHAIDPDAWVFASGDDERSRKHLRHRSKTVWYGRAGDNDLVPTRVLAADDSLTVSVDGVDLRLPVHGRQYVDAALAAYAVGRMFELASSEIALAMTRFACPRRRCEVIRAGESVVVNDASKLARSTLLASFDAAREISSPGRRIVVLGGLDSPLAGERPDFAREAGQAAVTRCGAHLLVVCGAEGNAVQQGAVAAGMPEHRVRAVAAPMDAVDLVKQWHQPGDVVLVKGEPEEVFAAVADQLIASLH